MLIMIEKCFLYQTFNTGRHIKQIKYKTQPDYVENQ